MMRFWKNLSQPSQFVSRSKVFAGPLVIGLLLISGTASGFQANSSPQDTAQNFSVWATGKYQYDRSPAEQNF